jgi:two-component system, cell cycle response regulator DivK
MKKILIVEDHPVLRKALRTQIELMGFTGITAQNGKDGIETAIAEKPDLIMMDSNMPEMDGLAATRILRATSETKDIAIIAVTAVSDIQSCIEAGCNDFLIKPFPIEELRKKIGALIQPNDRNCFTNFSQQK